MKGAKGASFMNPEYLAWINAHTLPILLVLFTGLSVVLHLLMVRRGVNIFKVVILAGTFALAFAFAGNDLVNFVGVPLAAWESWQQFTASGMAADAFTMEGLRKAVQTPTFYLWFSKKAHRVVQTSINLSSSTRGDQEQFGSSLPGRLIVRAGLSASKTLHQILPHSLFTALESRMRPVEQVKGAPVLPFDQVRAAINLVVSSILIASAPPQRSGSASGMLATARLVGQTTGAALMALLFHLVPGNSTQTALLLSACFALAGAVVSFNTPLYNRSGT